MLLLGPLLLSLRLLHLKLFIFFHSPECLLGIRLLVENITLWKNTVKQVHNYSGVTINISERN